MSKNPSYRMSHQGKDIGITYDHELGNRFERFIFTLEKEVILHILKKYYPSSVHSSLDFACGTGRITALIEKYTDESFGVDISKDMLAVARKKCSATVFIHGDLTRDDILSNKKFDLITCWRFFLNAEPPLRKEVLQALGKHLSLKGHLVCNIHMNPWSIVGFTFFIRKKIFKKKNIQNTLSLGEMKKLLRQHGYIIEEVYPLAHLPGRLDFLILPEKILKPLELMLTKLRVFTLFAKDYIIVCKKRL
ncbi:class I SAM-dependent methyltransferase [Candidatus Woesearchaeota archaeon]|nr:class I SAM-dependent methyltransferase [Candidatus Woesearchaeota archaeon]